MSAAANDVKSIFGQALELPDPAARAAFLAEACGENASLRAEVEGLLAAVDRAGDFLNRGPTPEDGTGRSRHRRRRRSEAPRSAPPPTSPAATSRPAPSSPASTHWSK